MKDILIRALVIAYIPQQLVVRELAERAAIKLDAMASKRNSYRLYGASQVAEFYSDLADECINTSMWCIIDPSNLHVKPNGEDYMRAMHLSTKLSSGMDLLLNGRSAIGSAVIH